MLEQHPTTPSTGAGPSRSPNPSGTRKRDLPYLEALRRANEWCGLPEGTDRFTLTRSLKKHDVAARLGWSPHQVFLTETLIGVTTARDWKDSSRPMVWLSQDALKELFSCKSDSNVRYHLRRLMELGVLAMRDSTNCHRKVHYDPKTGERIPFGLDLSPVAALLPRVLQTAEDAEEEHHTRRLLRQQIKSLRKSNKETLEQAIEDGRLPVDDPATRRLQSRIEALWPTTALTRLPLTALCELRHDAETLEADLVAALTSTPPSAPPDELSAAPNLDGKPTNICWLTSENSPQPITITNESEIEIPVAAGPEPTTASHSDAPPAARPGPEREEGSRRPSPNSKAPPGWLILEALPPSFAAHLPEGAEPTSTDFQAAANLTRSRLGVSPSAWREACQQLSPDGAALAIAVVASRSDAGEIRSAGGYLRGMLDAARKGELDLSKSLWGMVDRLPPAAPGTETAASPPPDQPGLAPHCSALPDPEPDIDPVETVEVLETPPDPLAPSLEALEPIVPASIRNRLGPHSGGRRRWLHLMHAAMTECLQTLSVSGPAWRGAMGTLGLHRTTVIGVIVAVIAERRLDPSGADLESTFLHLVREEAAAPGSLGRHVRLLQQPEPPAPQPPPAQEADAAEEIATQFVMTRICTGSPDPDGLEAVWRRMIARDRRWPYVKDVLREYALSHSSSAAGAPLHPETGR